MPVLHRLDEPGLEQAGERRPVAVEGDLVDLGAPDEGDLGARDAELAPTR